MTPAPCAIIDGNKARSRRTAGMRFWFNAFHHWASSSTAHVWVAVASADGSLTASSEYSGSDPSGSDPAVSAGRPAVLTARSAGAFHGENWPGGYTGSGAPGAGGNPRTGPRPLGPAVRKAPALHSDPRGDPPPAEPLPGAPWISWPGRRSGRRHAFSRDGGPPLGVADGVAAGVALRPGWLLSAGSRLRRPVPRPDPVPRVAGG